MQELICFSVFLYHYIYIDSFVFLEVAKRGAIAPLAPKSTTDNIAHNRLEPNDVFKTINFVRTMA